MTASKISVRGVAKTFPGYWAMLEELRSSADGR